MAIIDTGGLNVVCEHTWCEHGGVSVMCEH